MTNFDYAVERTLLKEGVFSSDALDRGGKTKYGITATTLRRYYPEIQIEDLTKDQAIAIYRVAYWDTASWHRIANKYIAAVCFDAGVNHGPVTAGKLLQRALNTLRRAGTTPLVVDGAVGDKTIARLNEFLPAEADAVVCAFNGERYAYYKAIVEADETQRRFIKGWMERLEPPGEMTSVIS